MEQAQEHKELQSENLHLQQIIAFVHSQIAQLMQRREEREAAISTAHDDLQEYAPRAETISSLYSMQGFHDMAELSQYSQSETDQIAAHEKETVTIQSLKVMLDSPYFARIDFRFSGEETAESIYIGRCTLMDKDSLFIHVHDWRAPISSVFYRFGLGKASYEAPAGTIDGDVLLKRQYEIRQGNLQYFFDADIQIIDEFLRNLLSKNATPQMKTIVETIQKDQDIVIRDMESDVLIVQGAAGSGKTSIALHRVAYLMYRELAGKLNANDILILSPSTVYEKYISHVLPELGESNVNTMLLEDIFQGVFPHEKIQSRGEWLEQLLSRREHKQAELLKASMAFKGSAAFVKILDRLVLDLPKKWINFRDVDYDGQCIAYRDVLKSAVCNPKKIASLGMRLKWLEQEIFEKVHQLRKNRMRKLNDYAARFPEHMTETEEFARWISIWESAALLKEVRAFTVIDTKALYRRIFQDKQSFYRLAKGIALPDNIEEILEFTCNQFTDELLGYDDAAALTYLHIRIHGCDEYSNIRQLVIDEAQDEEPLHFALLRALFPHARYTILGDVNQAIGKQADTSMYQQISAILGKGKSTYATMEKSFRCTEEIWRYSAKFLPPNMAGQCFSRSGEEPVVHGAASLSEMDDLLAEEVAACKEKGFGSIGLICKNEKDASILYQRLNRRMELRFIHHDSVADLKGTLVLPIYMAKGLEFDAVLICDADHMHYHTEDDKRLLYIASTRALHRLNLFYSGEISPLL
jgi:DNA helicase II / ATP-dependent DNA helicase PcrA